MRASFVMLCKGFLALPLPFSLRATQPQRQHRRLQERALTHCWEQGTACAALGSEIQQNTADPNPRAPSKDAQAASAPHQMTQADPALAPTGALLFLPEDH